jgi:NADPH:quinone reductase-like Zn-dependent oxidoreductase
MYHAPRAYPEAMQAVTIVDGDLQWNEHPDPEPGPHELLVAVRAAGLNGADMMQRLGFYPAPPGYPQDIPGMEFAGEVVGLGSEVRRHALGDRVMALVGGGAQAEMVLVDEGSVIDVPENITWEEAGGFPEVFTTAHGMSRSRPLALTMPSFPTRPAPTGPMTWCSSWWVGPACPTSWPRWAWAGASP